MEPSDIAVHAWRDAVERFVKGPGFTLLCAGVWAYFAAKRARGLLYHFSWMEVLWLIYNTALVVLFLIRTRPSVVTLNPVHWLIALVTSFSGMFFKRQLSPGPQTDFWGDAIILLGLAGSAAAAIALERSYDFLPALRGVTTGSLYRYVRHPMYVASIVIRLGYLVKHASMYNAIIILIVVLLYDRRAAIEERIMSHDPRYREYAGRVRYRFIPGVY